MGVDSPPNPQPIPACTIPHAGSGWFHARPAAGIPPVPLPAHPDITFDRLSRAGERNVEPQGREPTHEPINDRTNLARSLNLFFSRPRPGCQVICPDLLYDAQIDRDAPAGPQCQSYEGMWRVAPFIFTNLRSPCSFQGQGLLGRANHDRRSPEAPHLWPARFPPLPAIRPGSGLISSGIEILSFGD